MYLGQVAARDGLVRVLPGVLDLAVDVWLATHRDLWRIPRINQTFKELAAALEIYLGKQALPPSAASNGAAEDPASPEYG